MKEFTEMQLQVVDYVRKNCFATKLFYEMINKFQIFGKLNKCKLPKNLELDVNINNKRDMEMSPFSDRRMTNPQQFDHFGLLNEKAPDDDIEEEDNNLLASREYDEDKIKSHFNFLFAKEKSTKSNYMIKIKNSDWKS